MKDKTLKNFIKNYENMVQSVGIQEESTLQQRIISITKKVNVLCLVEYTPTRGKRKGRKIKEFFLKDRKLIFAKDYSILDAQSKRLYREVDINDFWSNDEIQVTDIAKEGGVVLKRGKKPEILLKRILELSTNPNDIVLDFFIGTGTTCAVAQKMGRQYIGVEQLEYGKNSAVKRLKKVLEGEQGGISKEVNWQGGGSFIYLELKKYNQAFVEKIQKAETTEELLEIWEQMKERSFLNYNIDIKKQEERIEEFKRLSLEEQKKHLFEILDKNQLYVNLSSINDANFKISEEEKRVTEDFYQIKK